MLVEIFPNNISESLVCTLETKLSNKYSEASSSPPKTNLIIALILSFDS